MSQNVPMQYTVDNKRFIVSGELEVKVCLGLFFSIPVELLASIHSRWCQNDKSAVARVSKQTIKKHTIISSSLLH